MNKEEKEVLANEIIDDILSIDTKNDSMWADWDISADEMRRKCIQIVQKHLLGEQ